MIRKLAVLATAALGLAIAPTAAQAQLITAPAAVVPANIKVETIKVRGPSLEGNLEGNAVEREVQVVLPPSYGKDKTSAIRWSITCTVFRSTGAISSTS